MLSRWLRRRLLPRVVGLRGRIVLRWAQPIRQSTASWSGSPSSRCSPPTARKIVEQHGGTIAVDSEWGQDTKVTIELPPVVARNGADATPMCAPSPESVAVA